MKNKTLSPATIRNQCTAHKVGTDARCSAPAIRGGKVCIWHGGKAPQVREAAERRLLEMADDALLMMAGIVRDDGAEIPWAVKLQAAKDILDRVGTGAVHKVEADVTHRNESDLDREISSLLSEMGAWNGKTSPPLPSTDSAGA